MPTGRLTKAQMATLKASLLRKKRRQARRKIQALSRGFLARKRMRGMRRSARPRAENKLLGTTDINPDNPNGTPAVSPNNTAIYWKGYVLTSVPTAWTSGLVDLAGMAPPQGLTANDRIGNYVYFKRTSIQMEIATQFVQTSAPPLQFRVIIVKARQRNVPAGTTDAPGTTLFINNVNEPRGVSTTGASALTSFDAHNNLINKRDWIVYQDKKFTLSHPMRTDSDGGGVGYTGRYPVKKNFKFNLNHYKKTFINNANNLPADYDGHYALFVFASNATAAGPIPPDNWRITMRGTTSYTDN